MPTREITKLTLYGNEISGNCMKPKWTADLLRVDYDWVEIDILAGESRTPAFLALSAAGQVPIARVPGRGVLEQSNAIMLYIAEDHDTNLIPSNRFLRGEMMAWMFWEQYNHETSIAVRRFRKHYLKLPDSEIDPALLEKGNAALARMDAHLDGLDFMLGAKVSLADIALVAYTRVAHEGGFTLGDFPHVQDWVRRTETALNIPHTEEAGT